MGRGCEALAADPIQTKSWVPPPDYQCDLQGGSIIFFFFLKWARKQNSEGEYFDRNKQIHKKILASFKEILTDVKLKALSKFLKCEFFTENSINTVVYGSNEIRIIMHNLKTLNWNQLKFWK